MTAPFIMRYTCSIHVSSAYAIGMFSRSLRAADRQVRTATPSRAAPGGAEMPDDSAANGPNCVCNWWLTAAFGKMTTELSYATASATTYSKGDHDGEPTREFHELRFCRPPDRDAAHEEHELFVVTQAGLDGLDLIKDEASLFGLGIRGSPELANLFKIGGCILSLSKSLSVGPPGLLHCFGSEEVEEAAMG